MGAMVAVLFLAGCAGPEGLQFPFSGPNAQAATADFCPTPEDCALRLKKLVTERKRDWIGVPQSPEEYADGTRLFAYRGLRKKLTCSELHRAIEDTKAASASLQEARYGRAHALSADVSRELGAEQRKRCRAHS